MVSSSDPRETRPISDSFTVACSGTGVWRTCPESWLSSAGPLWSGVAGRMPRIEVRCLGTRLAFAGRNKGLPSFGYRSSSREQQEHRTDELAWEDLLVDLSLAPELSQASIPKNFKLAKEVKRRAQVITAGRDLHDIYTVLYLLGHWDALQPQAQHYAVCGCSPCEPNPEESRVAIHDASSYLQVFQP
jgi:hypothetical protein